MLSPRRSPARSADVEMNANAENNIRESRVDDTFAHDINCNFEEAARLDKVERVCVKR